MPSPPTQPDLTRSATILGPIPSTCSGMRSRGICPGRASFSDSPSRPSGTGAPTRSVGSKHLSRVVQALPSRDGQLRSSGAGHKPGFASHRKETASTKGSGRIENPASVRPQRTGVAHPWIRPLWTICCLAAGDRPALPVRQEPVPR